MAVLTYIYEGLDEPEKNQRLQSFYSSRKPLGLVREEQRVCLTASQEFPMTNSPSHCYALKTVVHN